MTKAEHTSTTSRAPGASPVEDPIYEVLAEHRATVEAYLAASSKDGELEDGTPEWQEASAVTQAAIKREREAALAVLTTDPTTIAGVIALLDHVGQDQFLGSAERDDSRQTALLAWGRHPELNRPAKRFLTRVSAVMLGLYRSERIDLVDTLYTDIAAAKGIEAAIWGLGLDPLDRRMREGIVYLHRAHIERLEELKGQIYTRED
jgi:hypothetical protein